MCLSLGVSLQWGKPLRARWSPFKPTLLPALGMGLYRWLICFPRRPASALSPSEVLGNHGRRETRAWLLLANVFLSLCFLASRLPAATTAPAALGPFFIQPSYKMAATEFGLKIELWEEAEAWLFPV